MRYPACGWRVISSHHQHGVEQPQGLPTASDTGSSTTAPGALATCGPSPAVAAPSSAAGRRSITSVAAATSVGAATDAAAAPDHHRDGVARPSPRHLCISHTHPQRKFTPQTALPPSTHPPAVTNVRAVGRIWGRLRARRRVGLDRGHHKTQGARRGGLGCSSRSTASLQPPPQPQPQ